MRKQEIKLTDREIKVLKALKTFRYRWLARDKDGKLFAYENAPVKKSFIWLGDDYFFPIKEKGLFNFITWEDNEPTKSDNLLK